MAHFRISDKGVTISIELDLITSCMYCVQTSISNGILYGLPLQGVLQGRRIGSEGRDPVSIVLQIVTN